MTPLRPSTASSLPRTVVNHLIHYVSLSIYIYSSVSSCFSVNFSLFNILQTVGFPPLLTMKYDNRRRFPSFNYIIDRDFPLSLNSSLLNFSLISSLYIPTFRTRFQIHPLFFFYNTISLLHHCRIMESVGC